jgi:maltooligosyltrehalose trehalohydrolase
MSAGFRLARGASPQLDGSTTFSVWAPHARRVEVELVGSGRRIDLTPGEHGMYEGSSTGAPSGADYWFVLDGKKKRPDPVSRFQPTGVGGPSRIVDPQAFGWSDAKWPGCSRETLVIYELHIGTFTERGTFDAALEKLEYLCDLGITAVELMPVAEFPGSRNWGYDGVFLYAPQSSYGGPDGLKRLVNGCHARGLAVIVDVVYNHVGPEGNHLSDFGPYFSDRYRTPWGGALNFDDADSDCVRRHFIDNALYWLSEFHVDGLRLDAVHAIYDFSAEHLLAELATEFHAEAERLGRPAWLIAESDLNDTRVTRRRTDGGWGLDSQWSDDFHHSLFTALSGAEHGYFADYGALEDLHKALCEGFVYDGRRSDFRRRRHGHSAASRPGSELVVYAQNHDQIANASHGERLSKLVSPAAERLAAVVLVAAPNLVMLFQGQEWGETAPFHYFTSHSDAGLVEAVREGRRAEFRSFGLEKTFRDPQDEQTFILSKIDWAKRTDPEHAPLLRLYRDLIRLRSQMPAFGNCRKDLTQCFHDEAQRSLAILRADPSGARGLVLANFSDRRRTVCVPLDGRWRLVLDTNDPAYWASPPGARSAPDTTLGSTDVELAAESAVVYIDESG